MTGSDSGKEKPQGAWTAQETVLYMVRSLFHFSAAPGTTPRPPAGGARSHSSLVGSFGFGPHALGLLTHASAQLDKVRQGKFYILCPDNETRREVDQLRIMWGAGDVAEGRPALSRWHRDYKALFEEYVRDGLESLD